MLTEKENAGLTIVFYSIALILITIANTSSQFKSGPCTPNFDLISLFLLGPLSFILLLINGVQAFIRNKQNKYSFYLHLLAIIVWLLILIF
jgi:hypothetical protein